MMRDVGDEPSLTRNTATAFRCVRHLRGVVALPFFCVGEPRPISSKAQETPRFFGIPLKLRLSGSLSRPFPEIV